MQRSGIFGRPALVLLLPTAVWLAESPTRGGGIGADDSRHCLNTKRSPNAERCGYDDNLSTTSAAAP
jgi:hypothetical protein